MNPFRSFSMKHLPLVLLSLLVIALPAGAAETAKIGGYSPEEALRLGEIMYREGVLPSGEPMTAIVQGDIELTGTMSTCANCHLRSGLGALEGGVFSPPTNGARLYAPLRDLQDIPGSSMKRSMFKAPRPAYTKESLAKALITGESPNGTMLSETMPRYVLSGNDMEIMIYYLENLSSRLSPGVTDDEIRFATIVTDTISQIDRESLLQPLTTFINTEWNGRLNNLLDRPGVKFSPDALGPGSKRYRKLSLDIWELKGAPASWPQQLESLYRKKPVFALLGGVVPGKWEPVHRFCEQNQIPCILPITALPVISGTDWYTLYFSKGYYQEGETAAKYLSRVFSLPPEKKVVQVYREKETGIAISRGFADSWAELGSSPLVNRPLADNEVTDEKFWKRLAAAHPDAVLLVWLGPEDLGGIHTLAQGKGKPSSIFVSNGLLQGNFSQLPDSIREQLLLTYPNRLPTDDKNARSLVDGWFTYNKLSSGNQPISWNSFLLTRTLFRIFLDMEGNLYRDYFLDIFDDGRDITTSSVLYPKLSFGPGQRYAVKGCYVVTLPPGKNPAIVPQSDWVVY